MVNAVINKMTNEKKVHKQNHVCMMLWYVIWLVCHINSNIRPGKLAVHMEEEIKLDPYITPYAKINCRWLNVKNTSLRASLVAQWLRVCLPMRGTRVRALVWEDPTCRGAAGPVSHNY